MRSPKPGFRAGENTNCFKMIRDNGLNIEKSETSDNRLIAPSIGSIFKDRRELKSSGLHRHLVNGISGKASEGAHAIVLSDGYEDDDDQGEIIIYTGQGGNKDGKQIADQQWTSGNQALRVSQDKGLPIDVIRGSKLRSIYAPASGYRYDGQYYVTRSWMETGKSGFKICRFELVQGTNFETPTKDNSTPAQRVETTFQRIVRNTAISREVKELYDYTCQMCGIQIKLPSGQYYAEACHIKPLSCGGPDNLANVICLCPNCHIQFDRGAIYVDKDLRIINRIQHTNTTNRLNVIAEHKLNYEHFEDQRAMHDLPS